MTGLARSEFRRAVSRRLFHLLLLVFAGLVVFVGVVVFLTTRGEGERLEFASAAQGGVRIAADILFSWAVVVGASFVGAEWATGSMATLLTWEPRRGRVLAAKVLAIAVTAAAAALVVLVFVVLALVPSGAMHGSMSGLDGDWWREILGVWWRGGALVAMGAALGAGLAGVLRNTAGAVAIWLIFQFVVSQLLTIWKPGWFRWLPEGNVQLFLATGSEAIVNGQQLLPSPSPIRGGLTLLVYAAAAVAASYAVFRTSDVT